MKVKIELKEQTYTWELNDDKFNGVASILDCLRETKEEKENLLVTIVNKIKNFFKRNKKKASEEPPLGIGA